LVRIRIASGDVEALAELNDSPTAAEIIERLPIYAHGQRWGDEIYFTIPVRMDEEPGAREMVDVGTLAYWPPGNAFCIFFGRTPASDGSEPCAASPVNVVGQILSDPLEFKRVRSGEAISIEVVPEG